MNRTTNENIEEHSRLKAVWQLELLDTAPEPEFNELVALAAAVCGTPIGLVSLVDEHRQWFKASVGLNFRETPREIAFCDHTVRQTGLMMVEDATQDSRFADSPLVTGKAGLRFYAGVPLASPDGESVGALCVLDRVPRTLTPEQRSALRILASQVQTRFELRVQRQQLQQALADAEAAKARLTASERRFQIFMDNVPFLGCMKDAEGHFVYYNQPMAKQFDVSREFLLNKTDAELWPVELASVYREHDLAVLQSGEAQVHQESTMNPDGSWSAWRSYKFPCPDPEGRTLLGCVAVDVTAELDREAQLQRYQQELEAANLRLNELACIDGLTGVANRRCFDQEIKAKFRTARQTGQPLTLLLLDVDNFKQHNDRFGHTHGDNVLRTLGQCLQTCLRAGDLLARYGGEEFAILLPGTSEEDALTLADRLLQATRSFAWPSQPVTVSIGVSSLGPATADAQRLLTLADEALYAAKRGGKDRAVGYAHVYRQALIAAKAGHPAHLEAK